MPLLTSDELAKKSGIKKEHIETLRFLTKASALIKQNMPESYVEKKEAIQELLVGALGNLELNKNLMNLMKNIPGNESGINQKTADLFIDFAFRTRNYAEHSKDIKPLQSNFDKVFNDNITIEDHAKLNLKQFGALNDLSKIQDIMSSLSTKDLISGNTQLTQLQEDVKIVTPMISHLNKTFDKNFEVPLASIMFDVPERKHDIENKKFNFNQQIDNKLNEKITKYSHVVSALNVPTKGEGETNRVSHITGQYDQGKLNLTRYLYSDMYQMNLEKLANKGTVELLKQHFGTQWSDALKDRYSSIEREIHDSSGRLNQHYTAKLDAVRHVDLGIHSVMNPTNFTLFTKDHSNTDIRDDILGKEKWDIQRKKNQSTFCALTLWEKL